ncbi:hypothetical protein [Oharaeibacter diazotrophicus]|uniref:Uncharacterized protein n=1 Tax=Oharaeibacter diazotrophicus TaxID=1920512 RepID=A0A4R6RBF4_9HYPH|nr:hypothetical protein [Oharaeibacter diazotrophicus]TDP83471.1 hypothetical protein EDD54_3433 [Oharaeibacter diazotrophicus]BBE72304.1 hypothetical protein OHA_1_01893 [Pleomorphomonas sp. SM30]GLS79074.1 hypothetical protein GCM10007904_44110 [Oharaeibacter diazotrophicus]
MRNTALAVVLVLVAGVSDAAAGLAYEAPKIAPGDTVEPPADLVAQATALLAAARRKDAAAAGAFVGERVATISHSLDIGRPPHVGSEDTAGPPERRLAPLGSHTGGDWDIPRTADGRTVDVGAFLTKMELDFIVQSLTDGRPWGRDAAAAGAICTYAAPKFDRRTVARAAKRLGVESSVFREPTEPVDLLAEPKPGAAVIARLEPGRLYAVDYDAGEPIGWAAFHLPKGGSGFVADLPGGGYPFEPPYVSGLCFAKSATGTWTIVAQTSTSL